MGDAQRSFNFVKKLAKKKKEKKERPAPPLGKREVAGIIFELQKEYNTGCADCGAPTTIFALIYEGKRQVGRRCVCVEDDCLRSAARQFRGSQ